MPIRLLALDIDHTLLDHNRKLVPENIVAVQKAVDAGIEVVLASGRFRPSMIGFERQLGLTGPLIVANGAIVYEADGSSLARYMVDQTVYETVLKYCQDHQAHLNVYTETELLFVNTGPWGEIYLKRVHSVPPVFREPGLAGQDEILKLLVADDPARIEGFRRDLTEQLVGQAVSITESEPEYLEFLSATASKGHGLEILAKKRGLDREEIAAIGDYLNDVEMVQFAGLGGAVANAHPNLKAVADVHVRSNDEAGVAQFIEDFVLPNA